MIAIRGKTVYGEFTRVPIININNPLNILVRLSSSNGRLNICVVCRCQTFT